MSNHPIVARIKQILDTSYHIEAMTLFPSIHITLPRGEFEEVRKPGTTMADLAIRYFLRLGLNGDRTRQDLYGYPGLLRDLTAPPPWVEVTYEDIDGLESVDHTAALQPLYIQANETDPQLLIEEYRKHLENQHTRLRNVGLGLLAFPGTDDLSVERFRQELELARCIGGEHFEPIFHSVFQFFDDFIVMAGVPDLLVWSEPERLWFFAEVKGPRDSLRRSQDAWIRTNWDTIRGRFALVLLDGA